MDLTQEQNEIIENAEAFKRLKDFPAWQRIMQVVEGQADKALGALKGCDSCDGAVLKAMQLQWRAWEGVIQLIHRQFTDAELARTHVMEEVALAMGASQEQINDIIEVENFYG